LESATDEALAALPAEDRVVLAAYYLDGRTLAEVARMLGVHESTISRVTTNKYVHTPQGLFELKYFFNSSIRRMAEEDIASESVKQAIKKIIEGEDKQNPEEVFRLD